MRLRAVADRRAAPRRSTPAGRPAPPRPPSVAGRPPAHRGPKMRQVEHFARPPHAWGTGMPDRSAASSRVSPVATSKSKLSGREVTLAIFPSPAPSSRLRFRVRRISNARSSSTAAMSPAAARLMSRAWASSAPRSPRPRSVRKILTVRRSPVLRTRRTRPFLSSTRMALAVVGSVVPTRRDSSRWLSPSSIHSARRKKYCPVVMSCCCNRARSALAKARWVSRTR